MLTEIFGDSAAEAAWWGAVSQGLAAVGTFVAIVVALWLPKRAAKREIADRRAELAGEVMAAVLDLMTALEVVRARVYRGPERWAVRLGIFTELFASGWPRKDRWATALFRAVGVNQGSNDFAYSAVSGPIARCYAALTHASLCGSEDMRLAADQVRNAVASVLAEFSNKRRWARASRELDKAMERFRAITIRVTGAASR